MTEQPEQQASYAEAAKIELERVRLQMQDLEEAEKDINEEIVNLEARLTDLNQQYEQLMQLLEEKLQPRADELNATMESYKNWMQLQQQIYALEFISQEFNEDMSTRVLEPEEMVLEFDAKKQMPTEIWNKLSKQFASMVVECRYPNKPVAHIALNTLDTVVGGKFKKDEGKGYRAFLNTIMLFNLMKFLETNGKYALRMLFLDSPILSLKEKVKEEERADPGMRESLFKYILTHCGENQIIIIENELPENVDYNSANIIEFTQDEYNGRYGFLLSVQNVDNQ